MAYPKKTLGELFRVLKPGRCIRIYYEALSVYKDGYEKDIWVSGLAESACKVILYDRDLENEYVLQYGLTIAMPKEEFIRRLSATGEYSFNQVSVSFLEEIKGLIIKAQVCKTIHPSGEKLVSWLKDIGFKKVLPTYNGGMAAAKLFDLYTDENRPSSLDSVDEAIKKVVKIMTELESPIGLDPMITAIK